jgi:hypothetical protein
MLCAWSSQYPHRPIPPDQSRSVYRSSAAPAVLQRAPLRTFHCDLGDLPEGAQLIGTETRVAPGSGLWWRLRRHSPPRHGTDHDDESFFLFAAVVLYSCIWMYCARRHANAYLGSKRRPQKNAAPARCSLRFFASPSARVRCGSELLFKPLQTDWESVYKWTDALLGGV